MKMENKVIITFEEDGHTVKGTITKSQMVEVASELLAMALHLATSKKEHDKIGDEFISNLTDSFRQFESGESDD